MTRTIMYIKKYKLAAGGTTTILCLLLSLFSCTNDALQVITPKPEPGVPVKVELNFRIPKFENPQEAKSRTATEQPSGKGFHVALVIDSLQSESDNAQLITRAADAPLYNLWVFQFSANGAVRKVVRASTDENPVYENQTIEVELMTGIDQTIYLLALGRRYGHIDLSNIKTVKELESTPFDFIRYENGLPTPMIRGAEDIPYSGTCHKLSIIKLEENGKGYVDYENSNGFGGAINLKALVSLVTIDFTYQAENMTPFSISLNNVPTTFAVDNSSYKADKFVNLPTTLLNPSDLADGKRVTMSWYMTPNSQGTVSSITSEVDRYFYYVGTNNTPKGDAPQDASYIHIWASNDNDVDNYALYYLFLGRNTTNDFNIHPHSHYRYRTDINTADDLNDKRIIYKTLTQSVDFSVSDASNKRARLLRVGNKYDLDAHPDMRPMEITALRGTVSIEVLPGSDNGIANNWPAVDAPPIESLNSWIKLSLYPNYTEALNASRRGDPNGLTTSINLDASIPGLFKLYLYSDEYKKYVQDNPNNDNNKRSLFVRFKFRTSTSQTETYFTRMDQRSAFYLGTFGGDPGMNNGEFSYPKGLVLEAKPEYSNMQYLSYMPQSISLYGAFGVSGTAPIPSEEDMIRYGAYDTHNGRSATIKMAENEHKISPIATGHSNLNRIQEPRYVNGQLDLYQYKYYTNDGYAQRWCYDKNRDSNGNGYLDDDEIVWYMPSIWQVFSIPLNCYNSATNYLRDKSANGVGSVRLHSTTMSGKTNRLMFNIYGLSLTNNGASTNLDFRCVRDVEPILGGSKGVKYYVKDNYPVIDATGLMEGVAENRVNNPNVIIMPGPGDSKEYRGRVIRHYMSEMDSYFDAEKVPAILRKVSQRFRVAPCDVDAQGNSVPEGSFKTMTWAEAAGYVTDANTLTITSEKTGIALSGCAAYKGINGTDEVGTWRLPTIREAHLIGMMDQAMKNDNALTGYIPLYYLDIKNFGCEYWTASEKPEEFNSVNHAYTLSAYGRVKNLGGENNPAAWTLSSNEKSSYSYQQTLTRCIYDLP